MTASRSRIAGLLVAIIAGAALAPGRSARAAEIVAFSTGKARAMALGGAYFSAEDDLFSALWNPASFGGPGYTRHVRRAVYLAPGTVPQALRALRVRDMDWRRDDRLSEPETIFSTLWGVKGFAVAWRGWSLGFVNVDEALRAQPIDEGSLDGWRGVTGHGYTMAAALRLAPEVALGAAATWEVRAGDTKRRAGWSGSFGVLLRPGRRLNAGLTYVARSENLPPLDDELERIDGGTINGGVSVYPWSGGAIFADVRNLDESENRFGFAELHLGLEQTFFRLVSVRGGWYGNRQDDTNVFSAGVGIKPPWLEPDGERPGRRTDVVSYAYVLQRNAEWNRQWHMIALTVPIEW